MSDIQPGDVVVCVNADRIERAAYHATGEGVRKGAFYRVIDTTLDELDGAPCLLFSEGEWLSERFRKLNDEPDNAELVERIRKCRPIKVGVDA